MRLLEKINTNLKSRLASHATSIDSDGFGAPSQHATFGKGYFSFKI